jgi:hypothetical protein
MKLLKNIFTSLLIATLLLPLIAPTVLQLQQRYVQWEMMEALEKKQLITITVGAAAVHWVKKGKECVVNNQLFDVKNIQKQNGKLLLTGLFDKKEQQIKEQLEAHTNDQQKQQQHTKFIKLILQLAALSSREISVYKIEKLTSFHNPLFKNSRYQSLYCQTTTPPPKYIF